VFRAAIVSSSFILTWTPVFNQLWFFHGHNPHIFGEISVILKPFGRSGESEQTPIRPMFNP